MIAKSNGAKLVILNREPTPLDKCADLIVTGSIGELLPLAIKSN
jgi:NAD-dependent deacetylase